MAELTAGGQYIDINKQAWTDDTQRPQNPLKIVADGKTIVFHKNHIWYIPLVWISPEDREISYKAMKAGCDYVDVERYFVRGGPLPEKNNRGVGYE